MSDEIRDTRDERRETRDERRETRDERRKTRDERRETRDERQETRGKRRETRDERRETRDERRETRDERRETRDERLLEGVCDAAAGEEAVVELELRGYGADRDDENGVDSGGCVAGNRRCEGAFDDGETRSVLIRGRSGADGEDGWRPGNSLATAALVVVALVTAGAIITSRTHRETVSYAELQRVQAPVFVVFDTARQRGTAPQAPTG